MTSKDKDTVKGKKSSIEQTSLINEIIKRDRKFHSINTVFTLNLKRLKIIADKPNNIKKEHLDLDLRASAMSEHIKQKIDYYFKVPNEKYANPLTSSHEFGWHRGEKLNRNQRRHPKLGCDVTKYADEYSALKGRSPYATKEIVVKDKDSTKK